MLTDSLEVVMVIMEVEEEADNRMDKELDMDMGHKKFSGHKSYLVIKSYLSIKKYFYGQIT